MSPLFADAEEPEWTSESEFVYSLDTKGSPRAVKSAAGLSSLAVTYRTGERISVTAPDGTETHSMVAQGDGTFSPSFDAGGIWTLSNSSQGGATFTYRFSDETRGAGTEVDPAKLVDADELADLVDAGRADAGWVFDVASGPSDLFDRLSVPAGFGVEPAGGGLWRIVSSPDGREYAWPSSVAFALDSVERTGGGRTVRGAAPPVSYTGDSWIGDAARASSITFAAPDGTSTTLDRTGTGTHSFAFNQTGKWTLTLAMDLGAPRTVDVFVYAGFVLIFR